MTKKQRFQPAVQQSRQSNMLNVQEFVNARQFEIREMKKAVANASQHTGNIRVFQTLPRNLRRRAASHNVKRLPQKYRERAIREMEKDPTPQLPKKPPSRRKTRRDRKAEILKRQTSDKKWLETHIWHTKRSKMVKKWGYKLALHPSDKGSRAVYRFGKEMSCIHDASYQTCVELRGTVQDIGNLMSRITDTFEIPVHSARFTNGTRQGRQTLYRLDEYPKSCLGPCTFFWKQGESVLWLWLHPSFVEIVLQDLQSVAGEVEISSLAHEFNRFEFTGPRSNHTLHTVLKPSKESMVWNELGKLTSSASIPPGVILALTVHDPRLSFPDRMPSRQSQPYQESLSPILIDWPKDVAVSNLWNPADRAATLSRPKEGELNERRSGFPQGKRLEPTEKDVEVPILLVQRDTCIPNQDKISREVLGGWDLIVPKGWGMDFWKSFVFAGCRFIGLRDREALMFESKQPSFPRDWIDTPAYQKDLQETRVELQNKWNAKPPAKRVNFEKLDTKYPFGPNWQESFGNVWIMTGGLFSLAFNNLKSWNDMVQVVESKVSGVNLETAMIRGLIDFPSKGVAEEHAMIYFEDVIVGYVTSAHYSLSEGRGMAIACCNLFKLFPLLQGQPYRESLIVDVSLRDCNSSDRRNVKMLLRETL